MHAVKETFAVSQWSQHSFSPSARFFLGFLLLVALVMNMGTCESAASAAFTLLYVHSARPSGNISKRLTSWPKKTACVMWHWCRCREKDTGKGSEGFDVSLNQQSLKIDSKLEETQTNAQHKQGRTFVGNNDFRQKDEIRT